MIEPLPRENGDDFFEIYQKVGCFSVPQMIQWGIQITVLNDTGKRDIKQNGCLKLREHQQSNHS
jgi:hypothetical protein